MNQAITEKEEPVHIIENPKLKGYGIEQCIYCGELCSEDDEKCENCHSPKQKVIYRY